MKTHSLAEAAEVLGLSEWTLADMVRQGRVAHLRIGTAPKPTEKDLAAGTSPKDKRPIRFTDSQLEQVLAALTVQPSAAPRRRQRRRSA